jgi:peptidoglycan-associated lipoprotein
MRINTRTLSAAVFTVVLLLLGAGCGKKPVAAAPPPVAPPPAPPPVEAPKAAARINSFTVEPNAIERGQSATLRWSVANSTDMEINQQVGPVAANGTRLVYPTATTSYTLTARAAGGNDTRTVTVAVTAPAPPPPSKAPAPGKTAIQSWTDLEPSLQDALFDYDKSDIRSDAQQALTRSAAALKQQFAAYPTFKVVVEGHCDERGSAEYNLGLGDRRATSARDFLVQLGVPAANLTTISYGKEKPVCTDANEACYQRNRRAHLAPAQ